MLSCPTFGNASRRDRLEPLLWLIWKRNFLSTAILFQSTTFEDGENARGPSPKLESPKRIPTIPTGNQMMWNPSSAFGTTVSSTWTLLRTTRWWSLSSLGWVSLRPSQPPWNARFLEVKGLRYTLLEVSAFAVVAIATPFSSRQDAAVTAWFPTSRLLLISIPCNIDVTLFELVQCCLSRDRYKMRLQYFWFFVLMKHWSTTNIVFPS